MIQWPKLTRGMAKFKKVVIEPGLLSRQGCAGLVNPAVKMPLQRLGLGQAGLLTQLGRRRARRA